MKKSKKYKKWKRENDFIEKQRNKSLSEKVMGNCKSKCYSCLWAGYLFDVEKCQFLPYCCNYQHLGKIANVSIIKWNDNHETREEKYIEFQNHNKKEYLVYASC